PLSSTRFPYTTLFRSVVFGLSLPNSALRFERESNAFTARYTVSLSFRQDSQVVRKVEDQGTVRVASFAETSRTDESVVYQTVIRSEEHTSELQSRENL